MCTDCCEHLEDFNGFWQLVEQKQCSLKKEFLNVDVDCVAMKWTGGVDVDVNIDELPLAATDMDEKPLDMHNLSLLGSVLDVNVDSVEVASQAPVSVSVKEQLPDDSEEDEKPYLETLPASDSEPDAPEALPVEDSSDGNVLSYPNGFPQLILPVPFQMSRWSGSRPSLSRRPSASARTRIVRAGFRWTRSSRSCSTTAASGGAERRPARE